MPITPLNITPENFERALIENGIPPRPQILSALAEELAHENPSLRALEMLLSGDVAIAAGLLKTVNSPFYGLRKKIGNVREAMAILGLQATAQIVAGVALRQVFANYELERFWDSSEKIASISSLLAMENRTWGVTSADAYTFGLFRDCGIAVLLQRMPAYVRVLRQANNESVRNFTDVEKDFIPVSHANVGGLLAETWLLPDAIVEAITRHHDPRALIADPSGTDRRVGNLVAITMLAEVLYQRQSKLANGQEWQKLGDSVMRWFSLGADDMEHLQKQLQIATDTADCL